MKITKKRMDAVIRMCNAIAGMVLKGPVRVIADPNPNVIGYTVRTAKEILIALGSGIEFQGVTEEEAEAILIGVFVHEMLHVLRTDFDMTEKRMNAYPPREQKVRFRIWNAVEDPAIEYLRHERLSDFMNGALDAAIGYFYKQSPGLGEQETAFLEAFCAMILFGDVGVLKGNFKFDEAKEAFIKVMPLMDEAIEDTDPERRIDRSQEIFEILRPLWEEHYKRIDALSSLQNLLKSLGKDDGSVSKGGAAGTGADPGSPSASSRGSSDRRKKTIHLIDEKKEEETAAGTPGGNPADADDIYVSETSDPSKASSDPLTIDPNADYDIVDERTKKDAGDEKTEEGNLNGAAGNVREKTGETASGENFGSGNAQEGVGSDAGTEAEAASGNGNGEPQSGEAGKPGGKADGKTDNGENSGSEASSEADAQSGNDTSSGNGRQNGSGASESDGDASENESVTVKEVMENLKGDAGDTCRSSGTDGELPAADGSESTISEADVLPPKAERKDLGEELKELSRQLSEEVRETLDVPDTLLEAVKDAIERSEARSAREELKRQASMSINDIDISVPSPYYDNVKYTNIDKASPDREAYEREKTEEVVNYTLNLRSAFKKIFHDKMTQKEYKKSGKIDIQRFSGRKITARMFYKNTKPENKTDMSMVILIDQSGSMRWCMDRVRQTLIVLLEALAPFDVKVKVVGFTTDGHSVYYHYGNREWKNDRNLVMACAGMSAHGGTFLGHAIRYAGQLLKKRPERNKIYVCITDGEPSASVYKNAGEGLNDCRSAVAEIGKYASVIGVGIYSSPEEEECFRHIFRDGCVTMSSLDTLVKELPKRIKKVLA